MSDGIGVENVDTKVGTTQLFGLPEKGEVAVAGAEDEKPAPEAAKNPQRFAYREQMIRKDQQATMHEKSNKIQKPCKSPTGHPAGHIP